MSGLLRYFPSNYERGLMQSKSSYDLHGNTLSGMTSPLLRVMRASMIFRSKFALSR